MKRPERIKVTRVDLAAALTKLGLAEQTAADVVDTVWERIGEALARGEKVVISGFGTFRIVARRARTARNPRTGATVTVPGKQVVSFAASRELKKYLNAPATGA